MDVLAPTPEITQARKDFFEAIFQEEEGYLAVARLSTQRKWGESFFEYPTQLDAANNWVDKFYQSNNIYFCPQLLSAKKRTKSHVSICTCIWADLDGADYRLISPDASIVVESSPGRFHGYWLLDTPADPYAAEDASKRLAYKYRTIGVDQTGWDLTQVLRPPYTYNLKYVTGVTTPITRTLIFDKDKKYDLETFLRFLPGVSGEVQEILDIDFQNIEATYEAVLKKWEPQLPSNIAQYITEEPTGDWSSTLWRVECTLAEMGAPIMESFVLLRESACNKYRRDNRGDKDLWRDLNKAYNFVKANEKTLRQALYELEPPQGAVLLTDAEKTAVRNDYFIDDYLKWAKGQTDAYDGFHVMGAFMILSAILSKALRIHTSDKAELHTNLWAMILADTTIARKTTTMNMAMEFIHDIVPEVYMATDGSYEGIISAMSLRSGMPSLFVRDEFTGFLAGIQNVRYQTGLAEAFIKLYDGSRDLRMLRKETISIQDPIFMFYTGGIKTRIYEMADPEMVRSGFLPRFIFVVAEYEEKDYMSRRPKKAFQEDNEKKELKVYLDKLKGVYNTDITINIPDEESITAPNIIRVELTDEAWDRFDKLYLYLRTLADTHNADIISPTMERMSESVLKCAALLTASKNLEPSGVLHVGLDELLKAMSYAEQWTKDALEICARIGYTVGERQIESVFEFIKKQTGGALKAQVMRMFRLNVKEADLVLDTLEQRALVEKKKQGKGYKYHVLT